WLTEVRRYRLLERRLFAAPVFAASGGRDRRDPDVVASAPVAGRPAERGKAGVPAVGGDADTVDPRAADEAHPPAVFGTGAQHREGVVADGGPARQPPQARRRPHPHPPPA